ncbi:MAG: adenosylcobalamin-dependent ribonucleoside-diphosphate reductase [Candidatus Micrarchaeota archaeon]
MKPTRIRKRDGRLVRFDERKITAAILKAMTAVRKPDPKFARVLADEVVALVASRFGKKIAGVEDVQDVVEDVLVKSGRADVAKAYISYRMKRAEVREAKEFFGVHDDLKFDVNATAVMKRRYLQRDEEGNVLETPAQMFRRVARAVAAADAKYGASKKQVVESAHEFYNAMASREFLPNTPCLANAGTDIAQLSACFTLPVEDSLDGIFDAVKWSAKIEQSGGGVGYSFSKLRPKGDIVRSTMGIASGPVSFMRVFDVKTEVIKQGGRRRGALMGILRVDHPDIIEFVTAKQDPRAFSNFNISVAVTDEFMRAVEKDGEYWLVNPRTKQRAHKLRAREVFELICANAWRTGDPGLFFIDEANRTQPTPTLGEIESTNPCGEIPIQPFDSCTLSSINVSKVVENGWVDWEKLGRLVRLGVHFLDNVLSANKYPIPQIERITLQNRKIGLGVMGFAEYLIKLGVPYDSPRALKEAEKLMSFISREGRKASVELGLKRGSFPAFKKSVYAKKFRALRNATVTAIAPTGTISIVAGCSSGIEPLFAVSFVRDVLGGTRLLEVNSLFEQIAREKGFYSRELMMEIAKHGGIQSIKQVPAGVRRLFRTALDIAPEWHVRMQAAFQKHVDNATSKTVNLPGDATVEDVRRTYLLAWKLKCKGITVYRYGSKPEQVLYLGEAVKKEELKPEEEHVRAASEYAGGCPAGPACPSY